MTQTAVFDGDFNVLGPERSEINGFEPHRLFRRLRNPCLIVFRVSCSETSGWRKQTPTVSGQFAGGALRFGLKWTWVFLSLCS